MHRTNLLLRSGRLLRPLLWLFVCVLTGVLLISVPAAAQQGDAAAIATATAMAEQAALPRVQDAPPPSEEPVANEPVANEPVAIEPVSVLLPFDWRGPATIAARELDRTAPPLEATVAAGDFQIVFVPVDDGAVLRILPDPNAATPGALQIVWRMANDSADVLLRNGAVVALRLAARVYAPGAQTQLFIADDSGSSSILLDSLTWSNLEIARAVSADAKELRIGLRWTDVPGTAWLEVRGLVVTFDDPAAPLTPPDSEPVMPEFAIAPAATAPTLTPTLEPLPTMPPTPTPAVTSAAAAAAQVPTATPFETPTPELIIVTSTPTPASVFEAATRVVQATEWARILGPATATPENLVTATPTITPIVVTNTPEPGNAATATHVARRATAIAFTTGTPTPYPANAVIVTATPTRTPVPRATNTPRPTHTPTPIYVLLDSIPTRAPNPTPSFPRELMGKILFLTDYRGNRNNPDAMVINPDGSAAGVMTSRTFYNRALSRDRYSPDRRFHVYSRREGIDGTSGRRQVFYDDAYYNSTGHQLTYFGAGTAWAATWSPTSERVALVSNVTGNDEIWTVMRGEWAPVQLTFNSWEWDHHPSFSPDGSQIVFYSNRVTGRRQLWIMDADGSNQRQLTNFPFEAWNPVWVKYMDVPDTAPDVMDLPQVPIEN